MDAAQLAEEIDRKALEGVERIMSALKHGNCSLGEAQFAISVLHDAVSGLGGRETFDLISQASAELSADAHKTTIQKLFINNAGALVQLEYTCGQPVVLVKRRNPGSAPGADWSKVQPVRCEGAIPFEIAKQRMEQYEKAMLKDGYRRLN